MILTHIVLFEFLTGAGSAVVAQGTPTWRGWAREVPDLIGRARTISVKGRAREVPDVTGQSHYEGSTHN